MFDLMNAESQEDCFSKKSCFQNYERFL